MMLTPFHIDRNIIENIDFYCIILIYYILRVGEENDNKK